MKRPKTSPSRADIEPISKPEEEQLDFDSLIGCLVQVIESMKGTGSVGGEWLLDAEGLTHKFFSHCSTFKYLWTGVPLPIEIPELSNNLDDVFSLSVIARAAFENMLVFQYLFVSRNDLDTREARYWAWQLSDLLMRKRIMIEWMVFKSSDHEKTAITDRQAIAGLENKLRNNNVFLSLSTNIQRDILERPGRWRIPIKPADGPPSWADIATEAGFGSHYSRVLYPLLCSYAHSASLSVLQLRQGTLETRNRKAAILLRLMNVAIAMMIRGWQTINPLAESAYSLNPRLKGAVSKWLDFAKAETNLHL